MIQIVGWRKFQHYGKEKPPWIKLYRDTLNDFEIMHKLSARERWVLIGLWMLAATHGNQIPNDLTYLSHALREKVTSGLLEKLQTLGKIDVGASSSISLDKSYAKTETETEERQRRVTEDFGVLWKVHSRGSKKKALEQYRKAVPTLVAHEQLLWSLTAYVDAEISAKFRGHDLFRWIRDQHWEAWEQEEPPKPDSTGAYYD